jgi:hypothetical protein
MMVAHCAPMIGEVKPLVERALGPLDRQAAE